MIPPDETRVDWFRILAHLKAEKWSLSAISHFTGIPRSSLMGYKQGSQPSYHYGVRLLAFWSQSCGQDQSQAPMVSPYSFKA